MSQFYLAICVCVFAISFSVSSDTDTPRAKADGSFTGSLTDEIPLVDVLKELHGGGLKKPEPGDLSGAESNPGRKIVGVKKHKNYEIVLYEYSDEESKDRLIQDFDLEQPGQTGYDPDRKSNEFFEQPDFNTYSTTDKPLSRGKAKIKPQERPDSDIPREPKKLTYPNHIPSQIDISDENLKSQNNPPTIETEQRRRKPKRKTTPIPTSPAPRSRKLKSTTEKIVEEKDQNIFETPEERPHAFQSDEYSLTEARPEETYDDFYDENYPSKSTPFPWLRDQPRGKPSDSSRLNKAQKPTRVSNPIKHLPSDDDNDSSPFKNEDDPEIFRFPNPRSNTSPRPQPSKKPGRQNPRPATRPQSRDPDFEQGGPGAGKFKPTRRPSKSDPQRSRSGKKKTEVVESAEEQQYFDDNDPDSGVLCKDPTGKNGICQEYFTCSVLYSNMAGKINLEDYKCKLPNHVGICCPVVEEKNTQGQRGRALMPMFSGKKVISRQIRKLIKSNFNNSINFGSDSIGQLDEIEVGLLTKSIQVTRNTPAFGHNRFFPSSKKIRQVSNLGFELLQTSNDLSDRLHLTNEVGGLGLKSFMSSNTRALNDRCPSLRPCGINKYRQIDGSCNNLRKPKMGQSLTPLSRVLEPAYADGRWSPRISVRGFNLPSPRLLSQTFIQDRDNPDNRFTLMVMQFGQFVDHDISAVPIFTFSNSSGIVCCRNGQFLPPDLRHPNCMPIEIPADDPFYSQYDQRCMNFVRSRMAPRIDCSLGYADQMNAVTHWLDLSNVYGSTEKELRQLRLFQGGLLQFSELQDRKMLLPLKPGREIDYKAGDDRVNEMQGLMIMHLIWLREHNRMALELATINPSWNDEQLFQEARRISIAQYQHIIYNEWLPIIVGRDYMDSYGILPLTRGYFRSYDPEVDASIENSFSSAGFRFGHTLVQGIVKLINELGQDNEQVVISQNADNARNARNPNQVDRWIRGLAQQPIQHFDPFISEHLNGRLFQARGGTYGMDLSSLNIQRARDHGIPGYNDFRELCQTGKRARSFDDFKDWMAPEIIDKLRDTYSHPDDVDLWVGGISEAPLQGALVGPTFTCIIGDQFARTKKGDRYFYDLGDQTHSFSPAQLREIRKASFARILCDNGDDLEAVQPSSFLQPDFDFNSLVDCRRSSRISRVDLKLWEDEPTP